MIESDIIGPIIQDIIEHIDGSVEGAFSLTFNGAPSYYTDVTKVGDSEGSGPSGDPIIFGTDEAAYTYINGVKVYQQLEPAPTAANPTTTSLLVEGDNARRPWFYETDDGVFKDAGLKELFGGNVDGADRFDGLIASDFSPRSSTLSDGLDDSIVITSTDILTGMFKPNIGTANETFMYTCQAKANINQAGGFTDIGDGGELGVTPVNPNFTTEYQDYEFKVSLASTTVRIYMSVDNIGDVISILNGKFRKVAPAIGQGEIITHTVYDLSVDIVLGMFELNSFVVWWIEAITGLIKMTDGVNICVSDTAVVAGTPFTAYPRWNGPTSKMWITKDDSKGLEEQFDGFPAMGDTFIGIVDIYQTNWRYSFNPVIDFEYVYDELFNDELVVDEIVGEPVKEYL